MKEIKAYVRPSRVEDVIHALEETGIRGMTLINVSALCDWADPQKALYSIEFVEKYSKTVKLELVCEDEEAMRLVEIIRKHAQTGSKGDGKIFVADIVEAISIRTGATGSQAL
ncbi:MAG: P-II family nitrogen regulator [Bacteroidota bacterium]